MTSGLTLAHMLYAFAALDLVLVPLMAVRLMRANPDAPAAGAYIIIAAGIASALGVTAVATFSEVGRIPIL